MTEADMTMNNSDGRSATFAQLSAQDFIALGLQDVAYVKPTLEKGRLIFAIHTADGRFAASAATRELAFATVRQNDLEPLDIH